MVNTVKFKHIQVNLKQILKYKLKKQVLNLFYKVMAISTVLYGRTYGLEFKKKRFFKYTTLLKRNEFILSETKQVLF